MIRIEMQLSQKQKSFSHFFAVFLKSGLNLEHFEEKKKMTVIDFCISILWTPKTCLGKCLKSPVLEGPSISNMVNEPKHC